MKIYLAFFLFLVQAAYSQQTERYSWKHKTIAHEILNIEEQASDLEYSQKHIFFDNRYRLIDLVIDSAVRKISHLLLDTAIDSNKALAIFKVIDTTLTNSNFVLCILTEKLSEALTPTKYQDFICRPQILSDYKERHVSENKSEDFYPIDCDLSAFLYLAIGEVLHLPIKMVEVPNHYFVRWRFDENHYVNWDNNSADTCSDQGFREGRSRTSHSSVFTQDRERLCHYLQDMTHDDIIGYYSFLIGNQLRNQKRYAEAVALIEYCVKARPYYPNAINYLARMYVLVPELESDENSRRAYYLSGIADSLTLSKDLKIRDTHICTCAATGNFKQAKKMQEELNAEALHQHQMELYNLQRIKEFKKRKNCLDILNAN